MLSAEKRTKEKGKRCECGEPILGSEDPKMKRANSLNPAKITQKIRECGYVGQDRAVKAMSLFAYRHLDRLWRIENGLTDNLPKKTNMLLIGPTGCGKTYLIELLFKEILKIPTIVVDITPYTEAGYSGLDLCDILTRLLNVAKMDIKKAETGIVCLDEFDKIAISDMRPGGGKGKDITGMGVQRELLKMVEGTNVSVHAEIGRAGIKEGKYIEISTTGIPFIACGAFSGLKSIIHKGKSNSVGFLQSNNRPKEKIADSYSEDDVNCITSLQNYGFLPELIGRFSRIVPFDALGEDEIRSILQQNVMPSWKGEMTLHEIDMVVDDSLIEYIVGSAMQRQTGARSVGAVFAQLLEDAAYDAYSCQKTKRLILNLDQGRPGYQIEQ